MNQLVQGPGIHTNLSENARTALLVEILRELPSGQTVLVGKSGKGEYFGESALLTGRRPAALMEPTSMTGASSINYWLPAMSSA